MNELPSKLRDVTMGSCPTCGRPSVPAGTKNGYHFRRCHACRHLFTPDPPTAGTLEALYRDYSYEAQDLSTLPSFVIERLTEVVSGFARYRLHNRLLDVGFGAGANLHAADKLGWESYGIETSTLAVENGKRAGLARVIRADFLAAPFSEEFFDVIVMGGVIEHLPAPLPFLNQASKLLRPGGLLYVTTPSGVGISARVLGTEWTVVSPPEHLQLFSPKSLSLVLARHGFAIESLRCEALNPYELIHHFRTKWAGSKTPSTEQFSRVGTAYRLNQTLLEKASGRLVIRVANELLSMSRLGDELKVFAVKRVVP